MRTRAMIGVAIAVALAQAASAGTPWVDVGTERDLAAEAGKPILYVFSAAWCRPCRRLEDDLFGSHLYGPAVAQRFVPVEVVDRVKEDGRNPRAVALLQRAYGIRAFPSIVVALPDGTPVGGIRGYRRADAVWRQLLRAHAKALKLMTEAAAAVH